jgi:predicted RNase H-like HicB family nuclease
MRSRIIFKINIQSQIGDRYYLATINYIIIFANIAMLITYTAKYTKTNSGYMGQLIEWQEVITEGETIEECRAMLQDATKEMVLAYRQQNKEIPTGDSLVEQIPIEV